MPGGGELPRLENAGRIKSRIPVLGRATAGRRDQGAMKKAEQRTRARAAIMTVYDSYRKTRSARIAARELAADYSAGRISSLLPYRQVIPAVGEASIFNWLRRRREHGLDALALGRARSRRRSVWELDPEMTGNAEILLQSYRTINAGEMWEALATLQRGAGRSVPCERTVARFLIARRGYRPRPRRRSKRRNTKLGRQFFRVPDNVILVMLHGPDGAKLELSRQQQQIAANGAKYSPQVRSM